MKLRSYLSTGVVAGSFVLAGSMALAQTTTGAANAQKTQKMKGQTSAQPADIAVDHAGGNGVRGTAHAHANKGAQTDVTSGDSANSSGAEQRKHVANVKYSNVKAQSSVKPQTAPAAGAGGATGAMDAATIKSHSNSTNNREAQRGPAGAGGTTGASESAKPQ